MRPFRVLSEAEAPLESFHDCHVHGLGWRRDRFTFSPDLQYILEWIQPSEGFSSYRFSISDARITFKSVDGLIVSMDWTDAALDSEIAAIRTLETRTTPNGQLQRRFEVEFANPEAVISLWSTGYELELLRAPLISEVPGIRPLDDD